MPRRTYRLLIDCPDRPGIIAATTGFVRDHAGNILEADQHSDPNVGRFAMRLEIDPEGFELDESSFAGAWRAIADEYDMTWALRSGEAPRRVAIFVGPETHCVSDLLWRVRTGELDADVAMVVSNHDGARASAEPLGFPFVHAPVTPETKGDQEQQVLELLDGAGVELVVLARYMQILSPAFVAHYPSRIINIHHSFLPAFAGARPYHQAFERGVKLIGATSHYVSAELDDGPIIAQDTAAVTHRDRIEDLVRKGRDLERTVLARAVRLHVEDRIIVRGRRTVVFE